MPDRNDDEKTHEDMPHRSRSGAFRAPGIASEPGAGRALRRSVPALALQIRGGRVYIGYMRSLVALLLPVVVALVLGTVAVAQLSPSGPELLQRQQQQTDQALRDSLRQRQQQIRDRQQDELRRKTDELLRRQSRPTLDREPVAPAPVTR